MGQPVANKCGLKQWLIDLSPKRDNSTKRIGRRKAVPRVFLLAEAQTFGERVKGRDHVLRVLGP